MSSSLSLSLSLSVVSSVELNEMCSKMLYDICSRNDISYEEECNRFGVVPCVGPNTALQVVKSVPGVSKTVTPGANTGPIVIQTQKVVGVKSYKGAFPLPFSGKKVAGCCLGLKENEGLMTQCRVSVKTGDFCKTCENQGIKNGTSIPKYGTIDDRMKCDTMEYVAPNGDRPTRYADVMAKYNLTKEAVMAECEKAGVEIDARHFEVVVGEVSGAKGKGRPRKADKVVAGGGVAAIATAVPVSAGRRGRPKKDAKVIELDGDDLFAALVAEGAKPVDPIVEPIVEPIVAEVEPVVEPIEKPIEKPIEVKADVEEEEDEEEEEEETDVVTKVEINGKKYLKSKNSGVIYDIDTQDEIGEWNAKDNKIDFYEEEEEEYEEE